MLIQYDNTKHVHIFGVASFSSDKTTIKQQLNGDNHLSKQQLNGDKRW